MTLPAANASRRSGLSTAEPAWVSLEACASRAPAALVPWLAEPGLLTAKVRAAGGEATQFRMLRLAPLPLSASLRSRLAVADEAGLVREIEFACHGVRWIFAQSVFPESTTARYPWLRDLGETPLGEALLRVPATVREPLEYAEMPADHELALVAQPDGGASLWARRAVYRLAGAPIIVQEVFLPALIQACPEAT
jgi:chorismate--pyruvate lyase